MTLQDKIQHAIEVIKKAEKLALKYSDEGFHLAFSGGKDSQLIYLLAQLAGVKFQAYFYKTSVDPKELLSFIRTNYPNVIWIKPKLTMFQLILKKKNFPTRKSRFCCEYIKEKQGLNRVVIIGIRKAESTNRAKRIEFTSDCKNGCDKNLLSPALEFTDAEVWLVLKMYGISTCVLYKTQRRIGCIGCPLNRNMLKELQRFPNIMRAYINTAQKIIDKYPDCKFAQNFKSGQDAFNWWVSDMGVKAYIAMRDKQYKIDFETFNNDSVMAKRTKNQVITGVTPEQAEQAFADFATADARIVKINADMDVQFTKIREKFADELTQLEADKSQAFETMQVYATENKDALFTKKKSIETVHGVYGFRTGTPKLKTLKGFTWPAVTKLLEKLMPSYVRKVVEPAKDKLLADRDKKGVAEKLADVGIEVVQDETFYIERKTEEATA